MRRTIILCIAAIVALSACTVNEGEKHNPIQIGRGIATWTQEHIRYINYSLYQISVVDHYLATDPALREEEMGNDIKNLIIKRDEATGVIRVGSSYDDGATVYYSMTIATDGRLLSEGGTWSVNNNQYVVATNSDGMTATITNDYKADLPTKVRAKLTFEEFCYEPNKGARFTYNGAIKIEEQATYKHMLAIDIIESIEYKGRRIAAGELDVDYNYSANDHIDEVYMAYDDSGEIKVDFLGESCTVHQ